MAETGWQPPDDEIGHALNALGRQLVYPPTPDLGARVRARLEGGDTSTRAVDDSGSRPGWRAQRFPALWRGRRASIALLVALLGLAAALILSGNAGAALSRWLGVRGVGISTYSRIATPIPRPVGATLALGRRVTLGQARRRVHYRIVLPSLSAFRHPDEVYLSDWGQVALVYRARPGLPRAHGTGVGMLLTEFIGDPSPERYFVLKMLEPGSRLEHVSVQGQQGYWLTGSPHLFWYAPPSGMVQSESLRLAGNTLLWRHGFLTLRMEAALDKTAAMRIAQSVR